MALNIGRPGPKPRRNPEQLPGSNLQNIPPPPEWLPDAAKVLYEVAANDLLRRQILFEVDLPNIVAYANAQFQLNEANRLIAQNGLLLEDGRKNPATLERSKLTNEVSILAKGLGFTPYGRSATPGKEAQPMEEEDEFGIL